MKKIVKKVKVPERLELLLHITSDVFICLFNQNLPKFKHKVTIGSRHDCKISDCTVRLNLTPSFMILDEIVPQVSDNKILAYGRQPDQSADKESLLIKCLIIYLISCYSVQNTS